MTKESCSHHHATPPTIDFAGTGMHRPALHRPTRRRWTMERDSLPTTMSHEMLLITARVAIINFILIRHCRRSYLSNLPPPSYPT